MRRPSSFCSHSIKFEYQELRNLSRLNSGIRKRLHRVYNIPLIYSSTLLYETLQILSLNPIFSPLISCQHQRHPMENLLLYVLSSSNGSATTDAAASSSSSSKYLRIEDWTCYVVLAALEVLTLLWITP